MNRGTQFNIFQAGVYVVDPSEIIFDMATGEYYRWDGDLPKQVPAGSTPESTGGIGKGSWVGVGDASFRSDANSIDGISYIGQSNYNDVRNYRGVNSRINVYGISNVFDGASGLFILDPLDTQSGDNGGTTLIDSLNRRWKRVFSGEVNVKWFGAKGDGVSDDWNAIARANTFLINNSGGVLFYPKGEYLVSRAIRFDSFNYDTDTYGAVIPDGIHHKGEGKGVTIIKSTSYNNCFSSFPEPYLDNSIVPQTIRGRNLTVTGMTIDCNYNEVPDYGTSEFSNDNHKYEVSKLGGRWQNGSQTPLVATYSCDNYQFPFSLNRNDGVFISDCEITRSWYNGIELYKCMNVFVEKNNITHCGNKKNVFGFYSAIEPDNACLHIKIHSNKIQYCGNGIMSNGDSLSYATDPVSFVDIVDNDIFDITQSGIYGFGWVQDWLISGNRFKNIGRSPIYIFEDNRLGKVDYRHPDRINVFSNTINSYNLENVDSDGIRINAITGIVSGNTVINNQETTANTRAILITDSNIKLKNDESFNVIISDNICNGRFFTDTNSGVIQIQHSNASIHDNTIHAFGGTSEAPIIIYRDGCDIVDNKIYGNYKYRLPYKFINSSGNVVDSNYLPYFEAITTKNQTGLSAQWYTVDWDDWGEIKADTLRMYNKTSDTLIAPYSGYYHITLSAKLTSAGTYTVGIELQGNVIEQVLSSGSAVTAQVTARVFMRSGESIRARLYCSDGGWSILRGTRITFMYDGNFKEFNHSF